MRSYGLDRTLLPFQSAIDMASHIVDLDTPSDKLHQIYLTSKEIERSMSGGFVCPSSCFGTTLNWVAPNSCLFYFFCPLKGKE